MSSNPAIRDGDNPRRKKSTDIDVLKRDPRVINIFKHYLDLQPAGAGRWKARCPWHPDNSPSLSVYPDSTEPDVLLFNCFACPGDEYRGNVSRFIMTMEECEFTEAVEKIKDMLDDDDLNTEVEKRIYRQQAPPAKEKKTYELNDPEILKWIAGLELEEVPAREWLDKERGIGFDIAQKLSVGYRQDVTDICSKDTLEEIVSKDPLVRLKDIAHKGWIGFPYINDGKVVAIKYRSIALKAHVQQPGMKLTLYNLPTIDAQEDVYLTEGELDALVMEQAGFRAVAIPTATFKVTAELKDKLLAARTVYLAGDNDGKAGNAAMDKLYAEMRGSKRTFKLVWPDSMKDANQTFIEYCGRDLEKFKTLVQQLMEQARVPALWRRAPLLSSLEKREFQWVVKDLVPAEGITMWSGQPGGFKSYLSAFLADAVSTGDVFVNRTCQLHPVLILDRENPQQSVVKRRNLVGKLKDATNIKILGLFTTPNPPAFDDPELLEVCQQMKPFIIIDSLTDFREGKKENDADDMTDLFQQIRALITNGAVAVLILHHTPKADSGKYRGSTSILAAVDAAFEIEKMEKLVTVASYKSRDGEKLEWTIKVNFDKATDESGEVVDLATTYAVVAEPGIDPEANLRERICEYVKANPGCSKNAVGKAMGKRRLETLAMIDTLVQSGVLERTENGQTSSLKYVTPKAA